MNRRFNNRVLGREELARIAPSIFTGRAHERTSSKYSHIRTTRLLKTLQKNEWMPVLASESRVKKDDRKGFQKHMVRFRHKSLLEGSNEMQVNDCFPEIVLSNSHDGFASFQLDVGLFRLACSNGLIVANGNISTIRIKHMGYTDEAVSEASDTILGYLPELKTKVNEMIKIKLSEDEQVIFANSAAVIRWERSEVMPVDPKDLLYRRRYSDVGESSLWHTFNALQENIIKGGIGQLPKDIRKPWKRRRTRAVNSVGEDIRINRALWTLAEGMRQLKTKGKLDLEKTA